MKILIVEDEVDLRECLAMAIQDHIDEVITADNGEEAIFLAKKYRPDCILTDLQMPGLSDFALVSSFLKLFPDTKIIAMSGNTRLLQDLEGYLPTLSKPFSTEQLLSLMPWPESAKRSLSRQKRRM